MSTRRTRNNREPLVKGPNGRNLCRWCAVEVTPPRVTFCSDPCVHEFKLRSNPGYLRDHCFDRDLGVCAMCQRNCSSAAEHRASIGRSMPTGGVDLTDRVVWRLWLKQRRALVERHMRNRDVGDASGWDADHIVPVVEGGGECGLDNIRTLCRPCHKRVTAELRARLAAKRRAQ